MFRREYIIVQVTVIYTKLTKLHIYMDLLASYTLLRFIFLWSIMLAACCKPKHIIHKAALIPIYITRAACWSVPKYPDTSTKISNAHHSRHKLIEDGIPIWRYSGTPLKTSVNLGTLALWKLIAKNSEYINNIVKMIKFDQNVAYPDPINP